MRKFIVPEKKEIQSVARAINIIKFIAQNRNSMSLAQVSRGLGLSKSTIHGLMSTLENYHYLYRDQRTGMYQLGLKLFEMGQLVYDCMDLRVLAYPILLELSKKHEETVHLAVVGENEVVYIEKVDGRRSVRIISQIGGRNPLYCTGVGKVLLSELEDHEVENLVERTGMKKITLYTLDTFEKLRENLAKVRERGYAFDLEEIEIGLRCIAAPVRNQRGTIVAAISLAGPSGRMSQERLIQVSEDVVQAGNAISGRLGYSGEND